MVKEGVDGPGGAAAAEDVVVTSQDGGADGEGERDQGPVSGVARDASSRRSFVVGVDGSRDDLDRPVVKKGLHCLVELVGLPSRDAALLDDDREAACEFVLSLVPLLLGHDHPQVGPGEQCPSTAAEEFLAATVLGLVGPRLQAGSVVHFDESYNYPGWQAHELRAWTEFVENSGMEFSYLAHAYSDCQVSVRITATGRG